MNRHVNAISGRLSLRAPQKRSLELLDRVTELIELQKNVDLEVALNAMRTEFPSISDFEREFPSVCFSLATGVGKTRLMGAFVAYLHLAHGINNFFILAPSLTVYDKLVTDFTPGTPKYVFKGIAEFSTTPPEIITGETYGERVGTLFDDAYTCKINVFNISKINSEVRGGKAPKIKQLSEYIGISYFEYLSALPDLVLLMDESHRYRASAGVRAINELKPILGLELTATPFIETSRGNVLFKNIIYDYPLADAMADSFVKEPAVVTRKDFSPIGMSSEAIESMKLSDGIRLHESVKVDLETYAIEAGRPVVKPFILIIARDTSHAGLLLHNIKSNSFFEGRYSDKVIQVDSSTKEDEVINRLLKVENSDEPTEIVIHVNMLKEGWDVTNLYTIIPLRAANARTLIEQSIGRGLRLPYGKRTGMASIDRLNIIAHDKFQEIVDEARKPNSSIRIKLLMLDQEQLTRKAEIIISQSSLANHLGLNPSLLINNTYLSELNTTPIFTKPGDQKVAQITYSIIRKFENQPNVVSHLNYLLDPLIQKDIARSVREQLPSSQLELELNYPGISVEDIVSRTIKTVNQQSIDIPFILVIPKGQVESGFNSFGLELSSLKYPPVSDDLWIQHLRTGKRDVISLIDNDDNEITLEKLIVEALNDFDDIFYEQQSDLLFDLAGQTIRHLQTYLSYEDIRKVVLVYKKNIGQFIHAQMQKHAWTKSDSGYEVIVNKGFTELKPSAYKILQGDPIIDYQISPSDKSNMSKYLFKGFSKCLYAIQKFDSEAERILSVILERDAIKWFKPVRGQFQISYRDELGVSEYQPDFVAEANDLIYMLEAKRKSEIDAAVVLAKKHAAEEWCSNATEYALKHNGKRWIYVLVPHDVISENLTLSGLTTI
ncbi:DEAD/DEAH box helicase [Dyadobacter sediminis]|uniref:Type III restriction endonuclease subunit R n=1 Tax=Dyadobacter sediminis TaxID=1493691 RepID=A0A5R9K6B0_9BACT|nr:DEAD/DEAH box helicase family protein [Dyadobacter sediminis]TLU89313.1 type III restriction endonuclease subunit R [Dyadobacter sediminis]GGC06554.1 type III restriction endonuclease subunit R [Dyadobacter sediminis]